MQGSWDARGEHQASSPASAAADAYAVAWAEPNLHCFEPWVGRGLVGVAVPGRRPARAGDLVIELAGRVVLDRIAT